MRSPGRALGEVWMRSYILDTKGRTRTSPWRKKATEGDLWYWKWGEKAGHQREATHISWFCPWHALLNNSISLPYTWHVFYEDKLSYNEIPPVSLTRQWKHSWATHTNPQAHLQHLVICRVLRKTPWFSTRARAKLSRISNQENKCTSKWQKGITIVYFYREVN